MKFLTAYAITALATVITAQNASADQSGSLYIAGQIPVVTSIEVSPEEDAGSLNLLETTENKKVASVTEKNNTRRGYYVTLSSRNDGHLKPEFRRGRMARRLNKIKYSASYGGESVPLSQEPEVIFRSSRRNNEAQMRTVDFAVSYEGQDASSKLAGQYSDTLTFMITAR